MDQRASESKMFEMVDIVRSCLIGTDKSQESSKKFEKIIIIFDIVIKFSKMFKPVQECFIR